MVRLFADLCGLAAASESDTCPDQPRGLEDAGAFLQPGADLLDFVP